MWPSTVYDDDLVFYITFSILQVISRQWKSDINEALYSHEQNLTSTMTHLSLGSCDPEELTALPHIFFQLEYKSVVFYWGNSLSNTLYLLTNQTACHIQKCAL